MNNNGVTNQNINPNPVMPPQGVTSAPTGTISTASVSQVNVQSVVPQSVATTNISQPQANSDTNASSTSKNNNNNSKEKKKINFTLILLFIVVLLGAYILYSAKSHRAQLTELNYKCTPVNSYKEEKELDINSTIVQDLYKKVYTSIREDVAQPEWNNNMKLYLAYRQILESDKYDTNCNLFSDSSMEPYTCEVSITFAPKAFKQETLIHEWKKLFGENTDIQLANIKLENSCIGGYQYIPEREEFVQGYCDKQTATSYKVNKKLTKAVTYRNTIVLTENVKYQGNERMSLPEYLKNGDYIYTFRLDMNYNYVLVSKVYDDKYN